MDKEVVRVRIAQKDMEATVSLLDSCYVMRGAEREWYQHKRMAEIIEVVA